MLQVKLTVCYIQYLVAYDDVIEWEKKFAKLIVLKGDKLLEDGYSFYLLKHEKGCRIELLVVLDKDQSLLFNSIIPEIIQVVESFGIKPLLKFHKMLLFGKFEVEDFEHIKEEILKIKSEYIC